MRKKGIKIIIALILFIVAILANFNNELCNFDLNTMEWTPLKDIDVYYNILTKEQYMQNCYKIDTN